MSSGKIALSSLVLLLITGVIAIAQAYSAYSDVDATIYRAQVAADPGKMADRLDEVIRSMESRNMTDGYAAIIFRTPQNDVGFDYQSLQDIRTRARAISEMSSTSVEYQTGLADMRGTLREIEVNAAYFTAIRSLFFYIAIVSLVTCVISTIIWAPD